MLQHTTALYNRSKWVEIVGVHDRDSFWIVDEDGTEFLAMGHQLDHINVSICEEEP
jgi:hypothetical protein